MVAMTVDTLWQAPIVGKMSGNNSVQCINPSFSSSDDSSSSSTEDVHLTVPKHKRFHNLNKFFHKPSFGEKTEYLSPNSPPHEHPPTSDNNNNKKDVPKEEPKAGRKHMISNFRRSMSDMFGSDKDDCDLERKYGVCDKGFIGTGATAVVRLAHKLDKKSGCEKLYAVKQFRQRRKTETEREYIKKLTSEFCISSSLRHPNVVETVDLVRDEKGGWVEVMEYVPADLYTVIKNGHMTGAEVDCYFKQLVSGVTYMHSMGVAHRDLKPENLLLNEHGQLKITDFGVSDVFRISWEKQAHFSKGLCGSEPYIAPEVFSDSEYDAQLVDIWSLGIIYYCMSFQSIPFRAAKTSDPNYESYLKNRATRSYGAFKKMNKGCRDLIYRILDPATKTRITMSEISNHEWLKSIEVCNDCQTSTDEHHHVLL